MSTVSPPYRSPRTPRAAVYSATIGFVTGGVPPAALLSVAALLPAAALLSVPASAVPQSPPDTVRIEDPGLHPEGVEWDAGRGRFLVSSVTRGSVTAVEDDGAHRVFAGGDGLPGSIGVHIDAERGRLLVAVADPAAFRDTSLAGVAKLAAYDLGSGERLFLADLGALRPGARHFANDVTVGPGGTAYVTDSFAPVIYAVDPEGRPSVLVEDRRLSGMPNGIDHHPDGYLLVAVAGDRGLVRVPPGAPGELETVALSEPFAADGLVLRPDGALVAVAGVEGDGGPRSDVLLVRSSDGWRTAEVTARAPAGGATTATLRSGAVYVVNPHFEGLGSAEPVRAFEIYRVDPAGRP